MKIKGQTRRATPAKAPAAAAARMSMVRCATCRFFQPGTIGDVGLCFRYPPVPLASAGCVRPHVGSNLFCGEHQGGPFG